jgi:spore maturation protein SpmB
MQDAGAVPPQSRRTRLRRWIVCWLRDAVKASLLLFRVMIPILLATRVLRDPAVIEFLGADLIQLGGDALAPVMGLVGLPGEMGLVWATAMLVNIYGGLAVYVDLAPRLSQPLTTEQATVLGTMILVAHSLPLELTICRKAGTRFRALLTLRIVGAAVIGLLLHHAYRAVGALNGASRIVWSPGDSANTWGGWAVGRVQTLAWIFVVILVLLLVVRLLKASGFTDFVTRLLAPGLRALGLGPDAAPITVIGMTLGISYGGGLIISEARAGHLARRDVFFSLALMSLCHSLVEDSLLLMAIGAHWTGVFVARAVYAVAVTFLLVRLIRRLPDRVFDRWLVRPLPESATLPSSGEEKRHP